MSDTEYHVAGQQRIGADKLEMIEKQDADALRRMAKQALIQNLAVFIAERATFHERYEPSTDTVVMEAHLYVFPADWKEVVKHCPYTVHVRHPPPYPKPQTAPPPKNNHYDMLDDYK